MDDRRKKGEFVGALGALLVHVAVIALLILVSFTVPQPDEDAGGVQLEDGEIHADAISYTDDFKKDQVGIEIHSVKNRIVRRIFESLGYKVVKLDRVFFAGLTKKGLRRGDWRYLSEAEVNYLRMGSFE